MFSYLRISSVGLHRHWGPWIVALNKVYNREKKLEDTKYMITPFWTSIFRVRPFPPFSFAFFRRCQSSDFSVFLCFPWFTFVLFMTTKFVVFTSVAFWKDAANAKMQQTIPGRRHLVGNDSLADRFSHAEAMPPVLGYVTLLRCGIGFTKALSSQVLESKCLLSFTHPRTIYRTEKKKENRGLQKNASKNKNASAKPKMPQINWRRRRPSEAFFLQFGFARYYYILLCFGVTFEGQGGCGKSCTCVEKMTVVN